MSREYKYWECGGVDIDGNWCKYRISDIEMQANKFDLGCPRCGCFFYDFELITEKKELAQDETKGE